MISALSFLVVFTIVVFLGGAGSGVLLVLIISIQRTSRGPLCRTRESERGGISRRALTGCRTGPQGDE